MSIDVKITRRSALIGAAATPFLVQTASAAAPMMGASKVHFSRFMLGSFEVTTLLAGSGVREEPQKTFGMNVSAEEFAKVSADNFLSPDAYGNGFTPTLVNTGSELVLFDTGLPGERLGVLAAMEAAGYSADQVDIVVLTHMHGDHIGGLMFADAATFPNARYVAGSIEYDFWSKMEPGNRGGDRVAKFVKPLASQMSFIGDGDDVVSGITAMASFGHTPGHMSFMVESDGKAVVIAGDLANHHVWSLAYPDWEVRFDMDKAAAAASRRKVLSMVSAEKVPMIGYHLPFPSVGYVSVRGDGFHFTPATYQLAL